MPESTKGPVVATLLVSEPLRDSGTFIGKSVDGAETMGGVERQEILSLHEGSTIRVGRARTNDIPIHNRNVSRFHAVFSASASGVVLSDLSSLNGTFVNGVRISTPVDISSGDIVTIAETKITIKLNHGDEVSGESEYGRTQTAQLTSVMVTVLVVDVCGYTKISEALPPKDVAQTMHVWFQKISEIVTAHGGGVDKYIGDCVMALWRGSRSNAERLANQAFEAGLEMLEETEKLSVSEDWLHHDTIPWDCRVAINTGEALMGTVGGAGRRDFTVLGDTVNVAFRLEGIGGKLGTKFILSEASAKLIDDKYPLVSLGEVEVEGRTGDVVVYSPANLDSILGSQAAAAPGVSEAEIDTHATEYFKLDIVKSVLKKLEAELPSELFFHSIAHTKDVVREALGFAVTEGKNSRDLELLAIAAAYHDAGFIERRSDNEAIGAEMAAEAMRASGNYSEEDIKLVSQMILDTKVDPESPVFFQQSNTRLSPYLLDADVSNFGREDFFERLEASRKEQGMGEPKEIYARTLAFMETHDWQTDAARQKRDDKKQDNMRRLRELTLS